VTDESLTPLALRAFRRALRRAAPALRRDLPWVESGDAWAVFVSEVMLQQTSTSRVIVPWRRFLEEFATPRACADAPLAAVLLLWQGLGYPRRAKALHEAARVMVDKFGGEVPSRVEDLLLLPGVGPYTAHAVATFAFGARVAVLDTNVGRVLARALANRPLAPREAQELATRLLPREDAAAFNQAMLDLGAQWCSATPRCDGCALRRQCRWRLAGGPDPAPRSAAVSRSQMTFDGSDRQVRGRILKELAGSPRERTELHAALSDVATERVTRLVDHLVREGLIETTPGRVSLTDDPRAAR